ncbi:MAG: hypothetical protein RMH75_06540 [Archaeoglobaceae archaeon]|nr:hypothetical protein [Archaeoglobaceae archaeon]MDW7990300.1 hypothetical protein [Archaeoglobaceae archaeon]
MGGFRARNIRFCSVNDIGLAEEKLIWHFKLRHIVYIAISALMFTTSSGSLLKIMIAVVIGFIALMAALYPRKALSFEALLFGAFYFPIARKRVVRRIKTKSLNNKNFSSTQITQIEEKNQKDLEINLDLKEVLEDDIPSGDSTRKAIDMKKMKVRKV